MEYVLKYGCNPHQFPAVLSYNKNSSPLKILNGNPGYINLMDAFSAWQTVTEIRQTTKKAAAASFKHVSPAGVAVAGDLSPEFLESQFLPLRQYSAIESAYLKARGGDRLSSYGDVVAISEKVDMELAQLIRTSVSDVLIAPEYTPEAIEILRKKQHGKFVLLEMDAAFQPSDTEMRTLFGFNFSQKRNDILIDQSTFSHTVSRVKDVDQKTIESLIIATTALKYTQSNSIALAYDGQLVGVGAGQQSRIHCTRLACSKADKWFLQQHPILRGVRFKESLKPTDKVILIDQILLWEELSEPERQRVRQNIINEIPILTSSERVNWLRNFDSICMSSDAFIPFRDNIDRANRSNVQVVAQTGGALRDDAVTEAANEYGMAMIHTGIRLFTH